MSGFIGHDPILLPLDYARQEPVVAVGLAKWAYPRDMSDEAVSVVSPERLLDGRLKLRHLVLVTTIADAGSLARAAGALRITQPVVTRGLQDLERILHVTLFERSAQGVVPTVFGVSFIEHARSILAQVRQAGRTLGDIAAADMGTVTVGTHVAGASVVLPAAIVLAKHDHPQLSIRVYEATPDVLVGELIGGSIDLMVGRLAPDDSRLNQHTLYVEPIVLIARADHPAASRPTQSLGDLANFPWVVPVEGTTLRREIEQVFLLAEVPWPINRVDCTAVPIVRRLLQDGDFIAALPQSSVIDTEGLVTLHPSDVSLDRLRRPVGISTAAHRWLSPATEAMKAALITAATQVNVD